MSHSYKNESNLRNGSQLEKCVRVRNMNIVKKSETVRKCVTVRKIR